MRIFTFFCIMFIGICLHAQAAIIVLKDGRVISGDIMKQDATKVVVDVDGSSLTYYHDEIESIENEKLSTKEKLVQQLIDLSPTKDMVIEWASRRFSKHEKIILTSLFQGTTISELTKIRKEGMMRYFSVPELKEAIRVRLSEEGKKTTQDRQRFALDTMTKFYIILGHEATKILKQTDK